MKVVGLTGGVATGKSTVSRQLAEELHLPVIDADVVARWVVEPGRPAHRQLRRAFGPDYFHPDGRLNREKLGRHVFADAEARRRLNRCTHPYIRWRLVQLVLEHFLKGTAVLILDWPLLIEAGMHRWLPETVVVAWWLAGSAWTVSPHDVELTRLMARDHLNAEDAANRIKAQLPLEEKCRVATIVIDNAGDLESTRDRVRQVARRWNSPGFVTALWWCLLSGPAALAWLAVVVWSRGAQLWVS